MTFSLNIFAEMEKWKNPTGYEKAPSLSVLPTNPTPSSPLGFSTLEVITKISAKSNETNVLEAKSKKTNAKISAKREVYKKNITELIPHPVSDKEKIIEFALKHFDEKWAGHLEVKRLKREQKTPVAFVPLHVDTRSITQESLQKSISTLQKFDGTFVKQLTQTLPSIIETLTAALASYKATAQQAKLKLSYEGHVKGFEELRQIFIKDRVLVGDKGDQFSKTFLEELIVLNLQLTIWENIKSNDNPEVAALVANEEFQKNLKTAKGIQTEMIGNANSFMGKFAEIVKLLQDTLSTLQPDHPALTPQGYTKWLFNKVGFSYTTDHAAFAFPGIEKKGELKFKISPQTDRLLDNWFALLNPSPMMIQKSENPNPTPPPSSSDGTSSSGTSQDGTSTGTPGLGTSQVGSSDGKSTDLGKSQVFTGSPKASHETGSTNS